jgi:sugar lactone lactonase YvrE
MVLPTRGFVSCWSGTLLITASDSHDHSIFTDNPSGRIFSVHVDIPGDSHPTLY